jgi:heptosyltransferase-2
VRRILVIRLGLLGDGTAFLSPALQRLKECFPQATVHVLATPLQRPVLAALPFVDAVPLWTAGDLLEPRRALRPGAWAAALGSLRALRRERYDLALACYGGLSSAIALLSGIPFRVGFAGEAFPLTLTRALPGGRYDQPWHECDYNLALVEAARRPDGLSGPAGGDPPPGTPMRLVVPAGAGERLVALLPALLPSGGSVPERPPGHPATRTPLVVLFPGATNGKAKRWPVPHWAVLARRLRAAGATVVLAGGEEERALSRAVRERAGGEIADVTGRTALPELLALLARATAVVAGDTGPLHLAIALGRPVVGVYGPTDPAIYGPYRAARAIVVRQALPCAPCYRPEQGRMAECPLGHTLCQRLIPPEAVYDAVRSLLPDGGAPPHSPAEQR